MKEEPDRVPQLFGDNEDALIDALYAQQIPPAQPKQRIVSEPNEHLVPVKPLLMSQFEHEEIPPAKQLLKDQFGHEDIPPAKPLLNQQFTNEEISPSKPLLKDEFGHEDIPLAKPKGALNDSNIEKSSVKHEENKSNGKS